MNRWRALTVAALSLTYLQLVFGGIVRITGSGMGCGDHWPMCNGSWIPPFTSPTVMIEWTHRLIAALVTLAIASLAGAAWVRRARPGIGGRGGLLRPAALAAVLVVATALLGMVTVKLGNSTLATVGHWTLAMTLIGVLVAASIRTGALGGESAVAEGGTPRAVRSLGAGAALALAVVVLGGLTAKTPGAAAACPGFPLCGEAPAGIAAGAGHIQVTHRAFAFLLFFHSVAIAAAIKRRAGESRATRRAAAAAATLVLAQVVLGATMMLSAMPPVLRALHQAVGVAVWMTMFAAAYLARAAQRGSASPA